MILDGAYRKYVLHRLHDNSAQAYVELEGARHSYTRPYLNDHDLVAGIQVIVVRFIGERDIGPRNFERATSPSQRAGIEDRRNRDSGGYLWDCEISYIRIHEAYLA